MSRSREAIINDIERIESELKSISKALELPIDDKTRKKYVEVREQLCNSLDKLYDELDSSPIDVDLEGGLESNVY